MKKWNPQDREKLTSSAYKLDMTQVGPEKISIGEWIQILCELSLKGLNRRCKVYVIENETIFLKEYFDMFQKNGILALRIQEEMKKSGKTLKEFIQ